jgi:hypothetical protein
MQDYNAEVMEGVTIGNTLLNAAPESVSAPAAAAVNLSEVNARCGFFSGDWRDPALLALMGGRSSYDLLLTSDTLYSTAYFAPLLSLMQSLLSPRGVALIAAKRYYFGIGGSTVAFRDLVASQKGWSCEVVDTVEDGRSNIREIMMLRRTEEAAKQAELEAQAAVADSESTMLG